MDEVSRVIRLANGVELPKIGLGTFRATSNDVKTAVSAAFKHSIRHIDTAAIYKVQITGCLVAAAVQLTRPRRLLHSRTQHLLLRRTKRI